MGVHSVPPNPFSKTLYICVNLALEVAHKLNTHTTDEGLLQQLNYAKEQIGSLAEFYKDTGHLTGNSMFHALMLARFPMLDFGKQNWWRRVESDTLIREDPELYK
ncbi:hypothetical protein Tco_1357535 [Tanacetum coccineum]